MECRTPSNYSRNVNAIRINRRVLAFCRKRMFKLSSEWYKHYDKPFERILLLLQFVANSSHNLHVHPTVAAKRVIETNETSTQHTYYVSRTYGESEHELETKTRKSITDRRRSSAMRLERRKTIRKKQGFTKTLVSMSTANRAA